MPANLHPRIIEPAEVPYWIASVLVPFFQVGNEDAVEHWPPHLEADRTWAVSDEGRIVANCCVLSRDITVPAIEGPCPPLAMTAISGVGVHPTHRRRGLLTKMMAAMVSDGAERGEPLAGLVASEAGIYGRFGFGLASFETGVVLDPLRSAFARLPAPVPIRLIDAEEARQVLPPIHEQARRRRPGDINRNEAAWGDAWADLPARRDGASAAMRAVTDEGYVAYRVRHRMVDRIEANQVIVYDLYARDPEVEAALWRFVLDIDLVGEVVGWRRPVDDPLRWWLRDPRQLRTTALSDMLWIRPLDVRAALGARGYGGAGRIVLEVEPAPGLAGGDPAAGRYVLEAGPDAATCRRAAPGEAAQVTLGVAALGSLLMGTVSATVLAAARLLEATEPRTLELLDRLFRTPAAPFLGTGF